MEGIDSKTVKFRCHKCGYYYETYANLCVLERQKISDGLTQYDYCSKGEVGEYEWDEDCVEDSNDWEDARKGEDK